MTRSILAAVLWISVASANEGLWNLGMRVQGVVDFEPGNDYLVGPELGYSNYYLASHSLELRAVYLTSRLEQAFRENILKQDAYLFSPLWHFRRRAIFDPILHADLGYTRYDVENEKIFGSLDNDSWIAALHLGLGINLGGGEYGFNYHIGYNLINPESSVIYPVVFGFGIWTML